MVESARVERLNRSMKNPGRPRVQALVSTGKLHPYTKARIFLGGRREHLNTYRGKAVQVDIRLTLG